MRSTTGVLLTTLLFFVLSSPASAAMIQFMEFSQLTHDMNDLIEPPLPDNVGRLLVVYDKDPDMGYLNVTAMIPGLSTEPVWLVKNMPLFSMEFGPPQAETDYALQLSHLGMEPGMMVTDIQFASEVMPMPLTDAQGAVWAETTPLMEIQPVMPRVVNARGVEIGGVVLDPHSWPNPDDLWNHPFEDELPPWEYWSVIGCDMPNIPLNSGTNDIDDGGCVPAATANSMAWLKDKHPEIDFPEDLRKTYEQLSHLMNRKKGEGATTKQQAQAKLDFIEAHNLPIKVKVQNYFSDGNISSSSGRSHAHDMDGGGLNTWPTMDWINSETQDQEDVEINYGYWYKDTDGTWKRDGGHCVVLTGTGTISGAQYLSYKDDEDQDAPGGTGEHHRWITTAPNGAAEMGGEGGRWKHDYGDTSVVHQHHAFIDGVVSESYDENHTPIPSSETFNGYCEKVVRVIPPGKSLDIDFPESTWWCRNVTIYERDRSTDPPKDVKDREWNDNEGETRRITNDDPTKTKTIVIHCDDRQSWRPGYAPWSIDLNMVSNSKASTPGNPDAWGGFSMGWTDGTGDEFGDFNAPTVLVDGDAGVRLDAMPRHLGVTDGCQELVLRRQIPVWNVYWEQLGFILDVAELNQPGTLLVDCPATGTYEPLTITATGRYELLLGHMSMAPEFMIHLIPANGLDMELDCVGIPSAQPIPTEAPDTVAMPDRPMIQAIYPNPFNPTTAVHFALPEAVDVDLVVYDVQGRRVATIFSGPLNAGTHTKIWRGQTETGQPAAAGTYFVRMRAGDVTVSSKATLVK